MKLENTRANTLQRFTSGQRPAKFTTRFFKSLFAGQLMKQVEPGRFEDVKKDQMDLRSKYLM